MQAVFLKPYEKPPTWLECDGDPDPGRDAGHGRGRDGERTAGDGTGCDTKRAGALDERLARVAHLRHGERVQESLAQSVAPAGGAARDSRRRRPPFEEPAFAEPAHEALYAALGDLPEKCRIVVHLFYFEDMGTRQIAEVLGIKEPTVRTRLVRARKLLKQSLKEAWEDEQPKPIQSHDGRGPCLC